MTSQTLCNLPSYPSTPKSFSLQLLYAPLPLPPNHFWWTQRDLIKYSYANSRIKLPRSLHLSNHYAMIYRPSPAGRQLNPFQKKILWGWRGKKRKTFYSISPHPFSRQHAKVICYDFNRGLFRKRFAGEKIYGQFFPSLHTGGKTEKCKGLCFIHCFIRAPKMKTITEFRDLFTVLFFSSSDSEGSFLGDFRILCLWVLIYSRGWICFRKTVVADGLLTPLHLRSFLLIIPISYLFLF